MTWAKGQSGNPGGRPKDLVAIEHAARTHAPEAIKLLAHAVATEGFPIIARIRAAEILLDRGYGKPRRDMRVLHGDEFSDLTDADLRQRILELARGLSTLNDHEPAILIEHEPIENGDRDGSGER